VTVDFDLTEQQREFQRAVREFAEEVVAPVAPEHDRTETFPLDVVRKMGELGLFGLPFPERYGGLDGDFTTFCLCLEELARVDSSVAITLEAAVGLAASSIFRFGTEEQKERWLVPMCRGEVLGSFGLTEAGGGTDAQAIRTAAALEGGEWVINGSKAFITNSGTPLSKVCLVAARTGDGEISVILVPADAPGFAVGPSYR
jgi:alkylation response protein AidB-like acyl-CoA dehydrogenase